MPINNIALIVGYIQKASYSFNSFFCSKISLITIVANTTKSKSVTFDESFLITHHEITFLYYSNHIRVVNLSKCP